MKHRSRSLYSKIAAIALALSFGLCAHAFEGPREELAHAYYLLKTANSDYNGHRHHALAQVEAAGKELGIVLKGGVSEGERQWASDRQMAEARRLLADLQIRMEQHDRERIADRLEKAIREIDAALRTR